MREPRTIYLDHNATTPPSPTVVEAVCRAMVEGWGNPSSPHLVGRRARAALAAARDAVAELAGCDPDRLLFTSGATESSNHVIRCARRPGAALPAIVTTAIEHAAVSAAVERESLGGRRVSFVGVDANGVIDLESLGDAIADDGGLVSIQWVNNELGVIQPVAEVAELCARHGALLHVDACQALGKIKIDLDALGADFVSLSGHKIGAPAGIGALYVRDRRSIPAGQVGGEQERSRRAGTENLPGIVGFWAAARERLANFDSIISRWMTLRAGFEVRLPSGARVNGSGAPRVANTSSVTFPGVDGAALLARLDAEGVCVSQGSACHSARPEPSHVLRAIGLSEQDAYATLRFSFGASTTAEEIEAALVVLAAALRGDVKRPVAVA